MRLSHGKTKKRLAAHVGALSRGLQGLALGLPLITIPLVADAQGPSASALEEVVVTARRKEESLQDVPVAITALSSEQMERYAVKDFTSIGQMVPSMVIGRQATGSSANIYLRGVGSTSLSAGFDQSVMVSIDDLPMSRGREIINTQYDLQQVEVLKGPQALFFGKNSSGGVIIVRTADPTEEFEARLMAGHEFEAEESYVEGMISGAITDRWLARLALRGSKMTEGYIKNDAAPVSVDQFGYQRFSTGDGPEDEKKSVRLTNIFNATDDLTFKLKLGYSESEDTGAVSFMDRGCAPGRGTPLGTFGVVDPAAGCKIDGRTSNATIPAEIAAVTPYAKTDPFTDHEAYFAALSINYELENWTLTSITGSYGFEQTDANAFNSSVNGIYVTQYADFKQHSQEFRFSSNYDSPLNATFGLFAADTEFEFNTATVFTGVRTGTTFGPDPATGRYDFFHRDGAFDGTSLSAFAQLSYDISPEWELAGGARWSREEKDSMQLQVFTVPGSGQAPAGTRLDDDYAEENVSPEATLTWKPTDALTFYVAYKEGFKAGGYNVSQVLAPSPRLENGQFDAEEAKGFEVGMKAQLLDQQLRLALTAYDYDVDGLQNQIFDPVTTAQRVANAGTLETRGFEVEANYFPMAVPGLTVNFSAGYNDAKYRDYVGQCWGGQTIADGCAFEFNPAANGGAGGFTSQNFDGREPPRAPEWTGRLGASYRFPLTASLEMEVGADMSYSSEYYFLDALRPDLEQEAFTRWDASIRLINEPSGWEVALIGKNLTDEWVVSSGNEVAGQDTPIPRNPGTGTAGPGVPFDYTAMVERPRQIYLQFTKHFY